MTISNFPSSFDKGVLLRELMRPETTTGKNYYIGNHSSLLTGEKGASDNTNRGTFLQPFATLDYAITQAKTGNGDRFYIRPGYTLTIADATTLAIASLAGIQIIGLGQGTARPTISFATDAAAAIPITSANVVFANVIFVCNIASQNHMIDLAATDVKFIECEFREGTATGLSFITADTADADSDRGLLLDCTFYAPTAGNYDNAIQLAKDFSNFKIIRPMIYGDFDVGGIDVPAGGNAQVNLQIEGGEVTNLLTNVAAITINGTGSSGTMKDVLLKTDTKSTALDNGSLATDNVRWASITTDQVPSEPIFVQPDSTENILGADDSDNGFASTSVTDNRDGSVLERLESIIVTLRDDDATNFIGVDDSNNVAATTNVTSNRDGSMLERLEDIEDVMPRVVTGSTAVMVNNDDIFTITGGLILIESLVSVCITGNDATASTLQYEADPTVGAAVTISAASASLANAAAGATVSLQGTALSTAALLNASGANLGMSANGLVVNAGVLSIVIGVGSTTGTWKHYLRYRPLEAGVTVTGI